jgi:branched-chain amino acid transport system ATP-binding protein
MMDEPILKVVDLKKSFGGIMALAGVDFQVSQDKIKSIIGPNGAGKTTIFNLISGLIPPSSGKILFENKNIVGRAPSQICLLGIARTFQNIILFKHMTVLENVMVGRYIREHYSVISSVFKGSAYQLGEKAISEKAMELLNLVGLEKRALELSQNLPLGEQKLLEIARAMATDPKLILLDEPAAGLNTSELDKIITLIQKIRNMGIAVLLVEHNMKVVMEVSDEILVINFGQPIASGTPETIKTDDKVIQAYLGKEVSFARSR